MAGDRTFTIIKPNAVKNRHIGEIISMIESAGFRIIAMKIRCLSGSDIDSFYCAHRDKPFFESLYKFMTSGEVVIMLLERADAVAQLRQLVGATNPEDADEGTIRARFAHDKMRNAIHASDSDQSAEWESSLFFTDCDIIDLESTPTLH